MRWPVRRERDGRKDDPNQQSRFEGTEGARPEDGPPITAPEHVLRQAECGECGDDQESRDRAGRCVVRDEPYGDDGKHGEPDAKMESETCLLRIGHRPVDARLRRSLTPCAPNPRAHPSSVPPSRGARYPGPSTT